jgi:hypothetical protein
MGCAFSSPAPPPPNQANNRFRDVRYPPRRRCREANHASRRVATLPVTAVLQLIEGSDDVESVGEAFLDDNAAGDVESAESTPRMVMRHFTPLAPPTPEIPSPGAGWSAAFDATEATVSQRCSLWMMSDVQHAVSVDV